MSRLMVCDECAEPLREVKSMGSGGPCCVCGEKKPCAGPVTPAQQRLLKGIRAAEKGAPLP